VLKIIQETSRDGVTLRLEGRIVGQWVGELWRIYHDRRQSSRVALTVDLTNVTFIDAAGIAFFEDVADEVWLVNCSLFAAEQLKAALARQEAVRHDSVNVGALRRRCNPVANRNGPAISTGP
jgi:ABC-type transporter Mla MlaB component